MIARAIREIDTAMPGRQSMMGSSAQFFAILRSDAILWCFNPSAPHSVCVLSIHEGYN